MQAASARALLAPCLSNSLVECLPEEQDVAGSIPAGDTESVV